MSDESIPVIVSACRTPVGRYLGGLSTLTAPALGAIAVREADASTVAIRVRGTGNKQEVVPVEEFVARLVAEAKGRALSP